MKKYIRPLGTALVLALLAVGAYAASADDSLISLSYLRDTFFPKLSRLADSRLTRPSRASMRMPWTSWTPFTAPPSTAGEGAAETAITATPSSPEAGLTARPSPCPPAPAS